VLNSVGNMMQSVLLICIMSLASALTFRQGKLTDVPVIAATLAKNLMNPLSVQPDRFEVATDTGGGRLGWGQLKPLGGDGLWELSSIFVVESRRGEGVGSAVVRRLLAKHVEAGRRASDVYLLTLAKTRGWYAGLGFDDAPAVPGALALEVAAGRLVTAAIGEELVVLRGNEEDPG